jgi:hypothetical protein
MGSEAVRGGPIAGILFVFGRGVDDGPSDDIARGGEILGDFIGTDGCGNVLGDTVVTIIGAVGLFQKDEELTIVRAGTVEFQAGKFGLEVEGAARFHLGDFLSLAKPIQFICNAKDSAAGMKNALDG